MEDNGKRLLLAVAAAFGIMLLWQVIFPPAKEEKKDSTAQVAPAPVPTGQPPLGGQVPSTTTTPVTPAAGISASPASAGAASPISAGSAPAAGALPAAVAESPAVVAAPIIPPVPRGPEQELTLSYDTFVAVFSSYGGTLKSFQLQGEKYRFDGQQLDLVPTGDVEELRSFLIDFRASTVSIPPTSEWVGSQSGNEVTFVWKSPELEVTKRYKVLPEDYLIQLSVDVSRPVTATTPVQQALLVALYFEQNPAKIKKGGFTGPGHEWRAACDFSKLSEWSAGGLVMSPKKLNGSLDWGGFTHSYFLVGVSPQRESGSEMGCDAYGFTIGDRRGLMRVDLRFPMATLRPGDPASVQLVTAYMGPKFLDKLDRVPEIVGYETGYSSVIDLGWFAFLARPLLWFLQILYGFLGNWGVAIIVLTFFVKLATLYWNVKSMRSMKAMAALGPKVKELQKKHEKDRQRAQMEVMNLYKMNKVSPLAGCLPILLQMPIWLAFYRMLSTAGELYRGDFLWISDLTAPDPLHIIPAVLMGMMFLQGKVSPATTEGLQQKLMVYGLPLVFGAMSFLFPAGLALYMLTNTSLTVLQTVWMNRGSTTPVVPPASAKVTAPARPSDADADAAAVDEDSHGDDDADDGDDDSNDEAPMAKKSNPSSSAKTGPRAGGGGGGGKKSPSGRRRRNSRN